MNRATTFVTGAIAGIAGLAGWRYYRDRATVQVRYDCQQLLDGVEIRRYPAVVVAETIADSESAARGRLRNYLSGANSAEATIAETTPIRTGTEPLELTTPTGTEPASDRMRVGVYLPPTYTPRTAPEPTDRSVLLTVETPRTVAVRSVPYYPRTDRLKRATTRLGTTLADNELIAVGSPFVFKYDNSVGGSLTGRAEVGIEVD